MTKKNDTQEFREQFEAMYFGTLSEKESQTLRNILEQNTELQEEYNLFASMMLTLEQSKKTPNNKSGADLLPQIQKRIHIESRGKYFKHRAERQIKGKKWSGKQGQLRWFFTIAIFLLLLIILALGWIHILDLTQGVPRK